jgi:TonB family protein
MRSVYLALGGAALLASSQAHPWTPPPPDAAQQRLQRWIPGDVRCGDTTFAGGTLRRPYTALSWAMQQPAPRTYQFSIDRRGQAVSISNGAAAEWDSSTVDIAPSLAASHFAVTAPLGGCTVTYHADPRAFADAPVGDLVSYSITPLNGALPPAAWARIKPAGADCDKEPRAQWLKVVLPDYLKLAGAPGARDWSLVAYDLDAHGHPIHLRQAIGTGNNALDRAALRAMSQSRQTQGPRRGCLNPFTRIATRLPAPADIDPQSLTPAGSTCPADAPWETMPALVYPANWQRRSIEGWAIVAFDVAPWGGTGNVRVLASEPSDDFGRAAVPIVSAARKKPSSSGLVGCVERVQFKMGPGTPDLATRG